MMYCKVTCVNEAENCVYRLLLCLKYYFLLVQLDKYETAPYCFLLHKPKVDIALFADFCVFT